jgi:hypothetical protein
LSGSEIDYQTLEPSWSDWRSVQWLIERFKQSRPPLTIAVSARYVPSVVCHLDRARRRTSRRTNWIWEVVPKLDRGPVFAVEQLIRVFADRFELDPDDFENPEAQVRERINATINDGDPVVLVYRNRGEYLTANSHFERAFGPTYGIVLDQTGSQPATAFMDYFLSEREIAYWNDRGKAYSRLPAGPREYGHG